MQIIRQKRCKSLVTTYSILLEKTVSQNRASPKGFKHKMATPFCVLALLMTNYDHCYSWFVEYVDCERQRLRQSWRLQVLARSQK